MKNKKEKMDFPIKVTKKQREDFFEGLQKLGYFGVAKPNELRKQKYYSKDDIVRDIEIEYKELSMEDISNPDYKNYTKEEFFLDLDINSGEINFGRDILYFSYYESYSQNNPQIALNGIYSFNNLFSISPKPYPDSIGVFELIYCYAGNQFELAEYYLDTYFSRNGTKGNQFYHLVPLSLQYLKDKKSKNLNVIIKKIDDRLSKKDSKFWKYTLEALKAILLKDTIKFSENLLLLVQFYTRVGELHTWTNQINKYFPMYVYAIYAMAYRYLDKEVFEQIQTPEHTLWWNDFTQMNIDNNFKHGHSYIEFPKSMDFLNRKLKFS